MGFADHLPAFVHRRFQPVQFAHGTLLAGRPGQSRSGPAGNTVARTTVTTFCVASIPAATSRALRLSGFHGPAGPGHFLSCTPASDRSGTSPGYQPARCRLAEAAVGTVYDCMRVAGIASYTKDLAPLEKIMRDSMVFPLLRRGNQGVRRRQLHGIVCYPGYDPMAAAHGEGPPEDR
jgi:hypothetical protein